MATSVNNWSGAANAGTLKIFVTSTGDSSLGLAQFESGFATVLLANGWTETLQTYRR